MIQPITVCELVELQRSRAIQLVDVRSAGEFRTGHLAGAVNIPAEEVEFRVDDLATDKPVVMVCQAGVRAEMAAERVVLCRPDVRVLQGGVSAWEEAGNALVKSAKTRWSLERQVRLGAGVLVLAGVGLGFGVSPLGFGLAAFVGLGLTFAGMTDFCPMGVVLSKMPWNQNVKLKPEAVSQVTDGPACTLRP